MLIGPKNGSLIPGLPNWQTEMCPVFLLFLHAVAELGQRYPGDLAFSAHFLVALWDLAASATSLHLAGNAVRDRAVLSHHGSRFTRLLPASGRFVTALTWLQLAPGAVLHGGILSPLREPPLPAPPRGNGMENSFLPTMILRVIFRLRVLLASTSEPIALGRSSHPISACRASGPPSFSAGPTLPRSCPSFFHRCCAWCHPRPSAGTAGRSKRSWPWTSFGAKLGACCGASRGSGSFVSSN